TTAIFSVVDGVLLHPVPGQASERVVQIGQWVKYQNKTTFTRTGLVPPVLEALEASRDFFAELTWCDSINLERAGDEFATSVSGAFVPPEFFRVLGVRPLLGRTFAPDEAIVVESRKPMGDTTVILSHRWWKAAFGGDPNVLGTLIELGGRRFTVVGVMPEYFQYPGGDYWLPAQRPRLAPRTMSAPNIKLIARLKPGVSMEQTQVMLATVVQRLFENYPQADLPVLQAFVRAGPSGLLWALPLQDAMQDAAFGSGYENLRRTLFGFLVAIGFVLAIVCANVANLTLARTERRQHELAVRAALGAGRARLMRQLLTESLLLALLGGAAGMVMTGWGMKLLMTFNTLPRLRPIELDGRVLTIALVSSLLTGLVFGLVPAWLAGRVRLNETLTQSGQGATASGRGTRYRNTLVVVEVALAVVLLVGAGLMIRSVVQLLRVDPGFDSSKLLTVRLNMVGPNSPRTNETRNALLTRVRERLTGLPGVSAVGIFKDGFQDEKIMPEGRTEPLLANRAHSGWESSDFFGATRIPLLSGRLLGRDDVGENVGTVVVNEMFARLCWPGENAVGKRFRAMDRRGTPTCEVIGVVSDARVYRFDEAIRPLFYRPYPEADLAGSDEMLVVRTAQEPAGLVAAIRRELKVERAFMQLPTISVVQQALYESTQAQRTYRNYLAVFASVGLVLAALGIYGVLAYSVARRTREIGIRMAMGAERRHVMGMVLAEGTRLIGAGAALGLLASFWLTRLLEKQLFGVSPHDPAVLVIVVGVLVASAFFACWLPARRAAKVDPVIALRAE
ncbi:MAG: ADOP family duplicated permease, partial [Opitutaceae bacterium]